MYQPHNHRLRRRLLCPPHLGQGGLLGVWLVGQLGDGTFYTTGNEASAVPVAVEGVGGTGMLDRGPASPTPVPSTSPPAVWIVGGMATAANSATVSTTAARVLLPKVLPLQWWSREPAAPANSN